MAGKTNAIAKIEKPYSLLANQILLQTVRDIDTLRLLGRPTGDIYPAELYKFILSDYFDELMANTGREGIIEKWRSQLLDAIDALNLPFEKPIRKNAGNPQKIKRKLRTRSKYFEL